MALLAGIDEAGYGPHLGPLVVAAAAIEFPAETLDAIPGPDLWGSLSPHIHKRPSRKSPGAVVCDSKIAYTAGGVAALEPTVLGFLAACGLHPRNFADLLEFLTVPPAHADGAGDGLVRSGPGEGGPAPWERPESVTLPVAAAQEEIGSAAAHLADGLAAIGARPAGLWVSVAHPARLNRLIDGDRNKAGALFALAADLLTAVIGRSPDGPVHVALDRHGGRRYYGQLLSGAFPMTPVETLEESPQVSRYLLHRAGDTPSHRAVLLTVRDKCESWSLPTALASMAAKYVRELHMRQLNAHFQSLVPGLRPTAGYGLDAWRFLSDVADARAGVPDAAILRSR